ncbi:GLUG motif-containing protein [Caldifermentibacillus hisashii]|uniref:GLUG motif-containing protein n=1 Tax=Caldifermentibacillus hisashii TaxID=996558 RepID=UPI0034D4F17A
MLGSGTQTDPYLISTPEDLNAIRNDLKAYYELTNDIDMSLWENWMPIAPSTTNRFEGYIDGKGHKIINLKIISNAEFAAFIGNARGDVSNGYIKNLGLENVYVESDKNNVAGLVALNFNSTITNCYVTGTIKNTSPTAYFTGGIVGRQYGLIENCFTDCNVIGGNDTGGFVGFLPNETAILKNNYTKSKVSGQINTGGFYGRMNTNAGYRPTFVSNYFNKTIAGTTNYQTSGVVGKTTEEMKQQSTYIGWDFENVWYMDSQTGYPTLRVFANIPATKQETITVNSHSLPIKSNVTKNKKSTISTQSILSPVNAYIKRKSRTNRNVLTYSLPINTYAQKSNKTVRNSTQNVITYINPIHSKIERHIKSQKVVQAHISPITSYINVLAPIDTFIPNAYLNVIEGNSTAYNKQNLSNTYYIANPSYCEVIK